MLRNVVNNKVVIFKPLWSYIFLLPKVYTWKFSSFWQGKRSITGSNLSLEKKRDPNNKWITLNAFQFRPVAAKKFSYRFIVHTKVWILNGKFYSLPYRSQYSRNYEIHTPSKHIIKERETDHVIAHWRCLGTVKCKVPLLFIMFENEGINIYPL